MVKNLPIVWDTQVQCLGPEDPLKKEMASVSYLENSMDRRAWGATVHGVTRVGHNSATNTFTFKYHTEISIHGTTESSHYLFINEGSEAQRGLVNSGQPRWFWAILLHNVVYSLEW